jgi:DNA-binding transcriptional ArsR family regulator
MSISGILSENPGVITMDHVAEIRRRYFISNENISEIAKSLKLSHPTVRKAIKVEAEPLYQRTVQLGCKPATLYVPDHMPHVVQ